MRIAILLLILTTFISTNSWSKTYKPADFAKGSELYGMKISPNGKYLAIGLVLQNERLIRILDTKSFQAVGIVRFGYPRQTGDFFWANDERLVTQITQAAAWESEPLYYGELWAVNYNGKRGELIYGYSVQEKKTGTRVKGQKSIKGWAYLEYVLPQDEDHIIIRSIPQSEDHGRLPELMKLNIYSGKTKKITRSPTSQGNFIVDSEGEPRFVAGLNDDNKPTFFKYDLKEETWSEVADIKRGKGFRPLTLDDEDKNLFYMNTDESGFKGIHKYDIETGVSKNIYTDNAVDVTYVQFNNDDSGVYALLTDNGYPEYSIFNGGSEDADVFRMLVGHFAGQEVQITSRSDDGSMWIALVSSDTDAGTYYLFNKKEMGIERLFSRMSGLAPAEMSKTAPHTISASDGMEIPVYLTLPKNAKGEAPLVTLVHGGPHGVRDYWNFDREVQMLANEGYAVLRINYRGSGGYGEAFEKAGYRQWGDRIQWDIIDATNWARALPEVNGERVCIMGGSFGAYSALQSTILAGDVYDCAIGNAGLYDLKGWTENADVPDFFFGDAYIDEAIGGNEEELSKFSPTQNVDKLNAPVLIAHGKKDRRTPFSQAEGLRDALKKAGKKYEWFVRDSESHGFHDVENRTAYFETVADFLSKHLK